jgi:predicted HicB family RNase H-like nuclease
MRPREYEEKRISTAVRFPQTVHERLQQAANERDLSMNWLVQRAVEDLLDRLIPVDEMRLTKDEPR